MERQPGVVGRRVVSTPDEFALFLKALFTGRLFSDPAYARSDAGTHGRRRQRPG